MLIVLGLMSNTMIFGRNAGAGIVDGIVEGVEVEGADEEEETVTVAEFVMLPALLLAVNI
jgi:hypothetical protein